ncbi:MAG: thiol protease/hemagglutinin PrtT [Paludibacteraceae bacterium]
MNAKYILLGVSLGMTFALSAETRSVESARQIAARFCGSSHATLSKSVSDVNTLTLAYVQSDTAYFVFDKASGGSVIVSGDDNACDVLGYTDTGTFCFDSVPENCRAWLQMYQEELNALRSSAIQPNVSHKTITFESSVAPLLGTIAWNQNAPYNNLCPVYDGTSRAAAGCVATAMAQVMYYYRYPTTGTGSNSYTWTNKTTGETTTLNADFSSTSYDWSNMAATSSLMTTTEAKTAVATLLYHCGVSVDMQYGASSSASTTQAGRSLIQYFGYNKNIQEIQRNYYPIDTFTQILRAELDASRPVLYRGSADDGAHAFVCDGYRQDGYFHINWGWGGKSDGYFLLSALTPGQTGIGGTTTGSGYNRYQAMYIGIQPTTTGETAYQLCSDSTLGVTVTQTTRTGTFGVWLAKLINYSLTTFSGTIAAVLYDETGETQVATLQSASLSLGSYKLKQPYNEFASNLKIGTTIADGNYRLYLVHKASDASKWTPVRTMVSVPNYVNVVVSGNNVYFGEPTSEQPRLELQSLSPMGEVYSHGSGTFEFSVTNTGAEYNSLLWILIHSKTTNEYVLSDGILENIPPDGETHSYAITIDSIGLEYGDYDLMVMYDAKNQLNYALQYLMALGTSQTLTLLPDTSEVPVLSLNRAISFPDAANVPRNGVELSFSVTNTGGYFNGDIVAVVYKGAFSKGQYGEQTFEIHKNASLDDKLSCAFTNAVGDYTVTLKWRRSATDAWHTFEPQEYASLAFTLIEPQITAVTSHADKAVAVYADRMQRTIIVDSEVRVDQMTVYDVSGRLVCDVRPQTTGSISVPIKHAGVYVVRIVVDNDVKTYKLILD